MPIPTIGRTVHFVLDKGSAYGEHRPAIITKVWKDGMVGLQVFTHSDSQAAQGDKLPQMMWVPAVQEDQEKRPGTWHWPEMA